MNSADHRELLKRYFGHESLRAGQEEVIEKVLKGKNTLAILPTGGGKSLCYQFPAIVFDGLTVVISPLVALMRDQVNALELKGIAAARMDSSLDEEAREEILDQVSSGELKLLYVSPEKLAEPKMIKLLKSCLLYTSPSPRDLSTSRMPSSA